MRPLVVRRRRRPGRPLRQITGTTRSATSTATWLARAGARLAPGAAAQAVRLIRAREPSSATCRARRTQPGPRRPTALFCTNFRAPRPSARRAAGCPSRRPDQLVPAGPVSLCKLKQCGASRLPLLLHAGVARPRISRDTGDRDQPGAAAGAPGCPRCQSKPAYHAASTSSALCLGRSGYSKAPWTIRQDHPGGKAPATGPFHAS